MGFVVSYHSASDTGLTESDECALAETLGGVVRIEPFVRKDRPIPTGSILQPLTLIIVIVGSLGAKALVQEVVKDIYRFFKERIELWLQQNESARVNHFAVILNLESEGKRWHVAVDFKDEATLVINLYRLHAYLGSAINSATKNELVEFEYPKQGGSEVVLTAFGISIVLSLGALAGWYEVGEIQKFLPFIGPGVLLSAYGLTISLVWIGFVIVPWFQSRKYRATHERAAKKWVLELCALKELPDNSRLRIQVGGNSTELQVKGENSKGDQNREPNYQR